MWGAVRKERKRARGGSWHASLLMNAEEHNNMHANMHGHTETWHTVSTHH